MRVLHIMTWCNQFPSKLPGPLPATHIFGNRTCDSFLTILPLSQPTWYITLTSNKNSRCFSVTPARCPVTRGWATRRTVLTTAASTGRTSSRWRRRWSGPRRCPTSPSGLSRVRRAGRRGRLHTFVPLHGDPRAGGGEAAQLTGLRWRRTRRWTDRVSAQI